MFNRTRCPLNYLSPNHNEMRQMADRVGIKHFSRYLASDIAHIAAGGEVLTENVWIAHAHQEAVERFSNETPDADGEWHTREHGHTDDKEKALTERIQQTIDYHRNVCDFLRSLDTEQIPGRSPLEKAMNTLKLLDNQDGGKAEDNDDQPLPIFCGENGGNKTADTLKEILEDTDTLDGADKALIQETEPSKSSGFGTASDLKKMALATDMSDGKHIWLKVSRNLEFSAKLQVRKSVKFLPDREGEEIRVRPIANFGEFPKIQAAEYALPKTYRIYRAAAKISPIRERVRREEKQQLLYLLIDTSGSMQGVRIHIAGGVLMNRLKAVISGDAQVYVRFFDDELYTEHFAGTPSDAKALIAEFNENNFGGGGTQISKCTKHTLKRIEKLLKTKKTLTRPELAIVTDGEDRNLGSLSANDFGETKLHAFVIDNRDDKLINLARDTGGVGIFLK